MAQGPCPQTTCQAAAVCHFSMGTQQQVHLLDRSNAGMCSIVYLAQVPKHIKSAEPPLAKPWSWTKSALHVRQALHLMTCWLCKNEQPALKLILVTISSHTKTEPELKRILLTDWKWKGCCQRAVSSSFDSFVSESKVCIFRFYDKFMSCLSGCISNVYNCPFSTE